MKTFLDAGDSRNSMNITRYTFAFEMFEKNPYLCIFRSDFLAIFRENPTSFPAFPGSVFFTFGFWHFVCLGFFIIFCIFFKVNSGVFLYNRMATLSECLPDHMSKNHILLRHRSNFSEWAQSAYLSVPIGDGYLLQRVVYCSHITLFCRLRDWGPLNSAGPWL